MCRPVSISLAANRGQWCRVIIFAVLTVTSISRVHADEVTRRLQEELRKRNLYFGDVDGRISAQLAAALHRYQERKGFASTGQADTNTLTSLNIPPSDSATSVQLATSASPPQTASPASEVGNPGFNWPDIPVLRSDEARRMPVADEAKTAAAVDVNSPTPAPPPASAQMRRVPALEQVQDFIMRYLRAGQANDPPGELRFYADHLAFFDEGNVDHAYLTGAVTRYDHRWPERHFTVVGPVTVAASPDGAPDNFVVNFRMGFNVKNSRYAVTGKTDNTWTVAGRDPGSWQIISMKEQRVREK